MKKAFQEIMDLILELSEDERKTLIRLLRQMQASTVDKHWEDYL